MIKTFHFLRPEWLYALLPLTGLLWLLWRQRKTSRSWQSVVDPRLLRHLLVGQSARQRPWLSLSVVLGGLLSILAMAGPAWQKLEVPVFRQPKALVLLLDLSRSMDAADIKPSRLQRAQLKLRDILNQQKEGETALIVYAAQAFVVSPLSSDAKTIASQVNSLSTDLMPAQGSRPDRAINLAQQLLRQSSISHAGVLLITDGIDGEVSPELVKAVGDLVGAGHRLSILGVGSAEGAPIPTADGGFLKDSNGAIILPKLDEAKLESLARQGHGSYRSLSADDSDFQALLAPFNNMLEQQKSKKVDGMNSDQWRDEGPWLLLPLLLLAALAFRRGYVLLLLALILPFPHPAYALDWQSLWQRDDQRAQQALQANQPAQAAKLFKNPEWRAAANYRAGNFKAAADDLNKIDHADADYNRGNALARQGRLSEAKNAYEQALKRNPELEDAKFNRDLVEQLMKKQQSPQQQQSQDQKQQGDQKDRQGNASDKNGQDQPSQSKPADHATDKSGSAQQDDNQQADGEKRAEDSSNPQQNKQGKDGEQEKPASENQAGQTKPQAEAATKQDENGKPSDANGAVDAQQDASKLQQADKQWLQRIPDDPGGLWRRKFLYQYRKQQQSGESEEKTW